MKKKIREMTNEEIEKELIVLNTDEFKKIKSRVSILQAELRARKQNNVYK